MRTAARNRRSQGNALAFFGWRYFVGMAAIIGAIYWVLIVPYLDR